MQFGLNTVAGKLVASVAVLGSAATVAGLGTFGSFTATTSATSTVSSGVMTLALGAVGATNRLSVAATSLVPGDTIQRAVDLTDSGTSALSAITLTTTAPTSSLLDTSTVMGLLVKIDTCSVPWTETGISPAYVYTCSGTTLSALASNPIIQAATTLTNLTATTAGATDHLRITMVLPALADNTLQGQSSVINFAFTGTQRAATNR